MALTNSLIRRLFNKFTIGDDCWVWRASKSPEGYGRIAEGPAGGKPLQAHRVVYEWVRGPIPAGLDLDHLCRNRGCVNPYHLEAVTRAENLRRGIGPALTSARRAAQTHCRHGHELTPENTYVGTQKGGGVQRKCRACAVRRQREYTARRAEPSR